MLKWLLGVTALVAIATTAPVQQENEKVATGDSSNGGTPLLRVKRSDEVIMFGNHQNVDSVDVVKKSLSSWEDDSGNADEDEDEDEANLIDRNAVMETNSDRAEDLAGNPDIKDSGIDDVMADDGDLDVAELLAEEAVKEEKQEEEQEKAQEEAQEIAEEAPESSAELAASKEVDSGEDESPAETEGGNALALPEQDDYLDEMLNYYYGNYFRDGDGQYQYADKPYRRKRRSPKKLRSGFTAEGMSMADAKKNMRVKRDLTADDLEALLALEGNGAFREEFDDVPLEYYDDLADNDLWNRLEEPADEDAYREFVEETAYPVSDDEIARARDRLELMDMIDQNPDILDALRQYYEEPYEEENEEGYEIGAYPGETEEFWEEKKEEEEPELEYRSIVYDGQPGIFIPVKRQYISMVPGVRKRDFYPYSSEPEGHWGAFVDSQEKRNEVEAYERLYSLAQALRGEDDLKKKK